MSVYELSGCGFESMPKCDFNKVAKQQEEQLWTAASEYSPRGADL